MKGVRKAYIASFVIMACVAGYSSFGQSNRQCGVNELDSLEDIAKVHKSVSKAAIIFCNDHPLCNPYLSNLNEVICSEQKRYVYYVNIDVSPDIKKEYGIDRMPTTLIYNGYHEKRRLIGSMQTHQIRELFENEGI